MRWRRGVIDTDIHASGGDPGRVERLKSGIPMQRGGSPDEVARAVLWLLSEEASYSTGAILDVAGGRWAVAERLASRRSSYCFLAGLNKRGHAANVKDAIGFDMVIRAGVNAFRLS